MLTSLVGETTGSRSDENWSNDIWTEMGRESVSDRTRRLEQMPVRAEEELLRVRYVALRRRLESWEEIERMRKRRRGRDRTKEGNRFWNGEEGSRPVSFTTLAKVSLVETPEFGEADENGTVWDWLKEGETEE